MKTKITIEACLFGSRRSLIPAWHLHLPADQFAPDGTVTLRQLIQLIVRSEMDNYTDRMSASSRLRVLTSAEIELGIAIGKVDSGGREYSPSLPDIDVSFRLAYQAFEDRLYFVFIDDLQVESLDQSLALSPEPRLLFLKLVALAGG